MARAVALEASYAFCQNIARTRARNFYYSFLLLSREQRDAMCAIYAFMRYCDDISEGEGASREAIDRWRRDLDLALTGQYGESALWPAFHDTVTAISTSHTNIFIEMIEGVSSDLQPKQLPDLRRALSLLLPSGERRRSHHHSHLRIRFTRSAQARREMRHRVSVDQHPARRARGSRERPHLLPEEDIRKFGADLAKHDERFVKLMSFEAQRARGYYDESRPLIALVHARSRPSLWALIEIYRRLLARIERSNFDVLEKRIRVPTWEKLSILASAALR